MIFSKHSIDAIVAGRKTQARRIWKPIYFACGASNRGYAARLRPNSTQRITAIETGHRYVAQVGHTYAVQPGRNKAGVWWWPELREWFDGGGTGVYPDGFVPLRIRITDIRREDAREISREDALAEGFTGVALKYDFLHVWCGMHDKAAQGHILETDTDSLLPPMWLNERPAERYDCVAYTFEVVR